VKIAFDNISAAFAPDNAQDAKALEKLKKEFDIFLETAIHMPQYKLFKRTGGKAGWNGRVTMMQHGKIPTGLVPYACERLKLLNCQTELIDKRNLKFLSLGKMPDMLRDYQKEAVKAAFGNMLGTVWWPRGVIEIATGGGKTLTAGAMITMADVPTAFVVHREHLLDQTIAEFKKLGIDAGRVSAGVCEPKRVTVASVQTLHSAKKAQDWDRLGWVNDVEQLFYDEAHTLASKIDSVNTFAGVCNLFSSAYMRWALTGTAFRKDKFSNWILEGVAGPVIYAIRSEKLIEEGHLSPPNIKMIEVRADWQTPNRWPTCYEHGIMLNKERNMHIVNEAATLPTPCIIMVDQIGHGDLIQGLMLKHLMREVPFVRGDTSKEERLQWIQACKDGKVPFMITSTIFDEGLDIPNLRSIILAGGKKSEIRSIQRLGRGLRRAVGKVAVEVVDFYDLNPKILEKHSKLRLATWTDEGFNVNIIKVGV